VIGVDEESIFNEGSSADPVYDLTGDRDDSGFDPALLTALSRQRLAAIATGKIPVSLLFTAPVDDLGPGSASLLATRWVRDPGARAADVRHLVPAGDRWTVAELEELVLAPTHRYPVERHVFIIERADAMDPRCADRLLKTLEEPPSATTFVLCATDAAAIPATIRGRVEQHLQLDPASAEVRVEALVASGIERGTAQEAVELAGPAVSLASLIAQYPDLAATARAVMHHQAWTVTAAPASDAQAIIDNASILAASWLQGKSVKRSTERLTPVERARLRLLLSICFDRYRAATSAQLTQLAGEAGGALHVDGGYVTTKGVQARLEALESAERQLRSFTSPRLVIASLLTV
jgi:hypothetical protein